MRPGLFRQLLFWLHLISGVVASLVIALMSATGVALTFEPQVLASIEDTERTLTSAPAEGTPKLPLSELLERVKREHPEAKAASLTVFPEPDSAVLVGVGRRDGWWVNPYSGESWEAGTSAWVGVFGTLTGLHRWLALEGEGRVVGKAITGACNVAFLILALTGLVLWWPRRWTKPVLKATAWFRGGLKGKARDFNWHNAIGFWTLPVIIVLVVSGMVISYGWASDLVYRAVGETPMRGRGAAKPVPVPAPPPGSAPASLDAAFASAATAAPSFERLTLRLPSEGGERAGRGVGGAEARGGGERAGRGAGGAEARGGGARGERGSGGEAQARPTGPQALQFTARAEGKTPVNANTQFFVDPFTAKVLASEGPGNLSTGRTLRVWMRYLHTGEALGVVGQLVAGVASLGALLLVWTGLALSWRRFFRRRSAKGGLGASAGLEIPELAPQADAAPRSAA